MSITDVRPQREGGKRPGKRRSGRRLAAGLAAVLALAAGADIAGRALHGHGHWHALAAALYHRLEAGRRAEAAAPPPERADAPLTIYDDRLGDGWQDWSWATHALDARVPVHRGTAAITMTPRDNQGVYLHHDPLETGGYGALVFWLHGPADLKVCLADAGAKFLPFVPLARYRAAAGSGGWSPVRIPLSALGISREGGTITGVVFQTAGAAVQPLMAFDDIALTPDPSLPPAPTRATVAVSVRTAAGAAISPLIYGMAFAPPDYLSDLHLAVNRWGGNDKSRYNWTLGNADNAARDWEWRNRRATDADLPSEPSSAADRFVQDNRIARAASLLTVPTIGWVARDSDNGHRSENVPDHGGPGLSGADGAIAGYDPAANRDHTSVRSLPRRGNPYTDRTPGGVVYQDEWIRHLVSRFGDAAHGGVALYAMDNEPDLWDSTHTDVHPARMGYDDVLHTFLDYASAVKAVDPAAQITGPVSWGWTGFEYSALDRGDDNFQTHADKARHGDVWFLPWFLKQVRAHDLRTGRRTLDVLDVHYYPQAQGVNSGEDDPAVQARRLRATRSLWDPDYADESWIGEPVRLIPRLREWIGSGYPGTRIGITEWNFGADEHIDGGLAAADVLGLFGREGVFLADYWAYPAKNKPAYLAFKLYRNADGAGHGFGDRSCQAASQDPGRLACYAGRDTQTGDLTLMLINKMPKATVFAPIAFDQAPGTQARGWRLSGADSGRIAALPPQPVAGRTLTVTLPPYSITLLRIAPKGGNRP